MSDQEQRRAEDRELSEAIARELEPNPELVYDYWPGGSISYMDSAQYLWRAAVGTHSEWSGSPIDDPKMEPRSFTYSHGASSRLLDALALAGFEVSVKVMRSGSPTAEGGTDFKLTYWCRLDYHGDKRNWQSARSGGKTLCLAVRDAATKALGIVENDT